MERTALVKDAISMNDSWEVLVNAESNTAALVLRMSGTPTQPAHLVEDDCHEEGGEL